MFAATVNFNAMSDVLQAPLWVTENGVGGVRIPPMFFKGCRIRNGPPNTYFRRF